MIVDRATEAGITAKRVVIAETAGIVARTGIVARAGIVGIVAMVAGIVAMAGIATVATAGGVRNMIEVTTVAMIEAGIVDIGRGVTIVVMGPVRLVTIVGRATIDTGMTVGTMIGGEVMIEVVGTAGMAMVGITGMVPADGTMETVRMTDRTDNQGTARGMGTGHVKTMDVTNATNGRTNSGQQI